jgi:AcrR family transcriptional regulator
MAFVNQAADPPVPPPPPRERILAAARHLFTSEGLHAVSVDEIASAAQTNKMTLYRHFESKDRLITEYLRVLAAEAETVWAEIVHRHPRDPLAQLRAWIRHMGERLSEPGSRGCPLANAAVELADKDHPARTVIELHKLRQREHLLLLCREAGFSEPDRLADAIFLLIEGARIDIQSAGARGPGARLVSTAFTLLDAHSRRVN